MANRNKSGVKILSVFPSKTTLLAMRVKDNKVLNLPEDLDVKISKLVFEERMHWELWAESSNSYDELKKSLTKRGYSNIPLSSTPTIERDLPVIVAKGKEAPKVALKIESKIRCMIQKN